MSKIRGVRFNTNPWFIHRTRQNFPNDGLDTFKNMAKVGVYIIDRAVQEVLGGGVDLEKDVWYVPLVKK